MSTLKHLFPAGNWAAVYGTVNNPLILPVVGWGLEADIEGTRRLVGYVSQGSPVLTPATEVDGVFVDYLDLNFIGVDHQVQDPTLDQRILVKAMRESLTLQGRSVADLLQLGEVDPTPDEEDG